MENLANYESGEESENNSVDSPEKRTNNEPSLGTGDLMSEWEAFASSIAGEVAPPSGVPPPPVSKPSMPALPVGDANLSTTVVSSEESDSESEKSSKKQDSSAESSGSEQQSSDEDGEEEGDATSGDDDNDDESENGSDDSSGESSGVEEDAEATPQKAPKRKSSQEDDVIRNRFRSVSPEEKKAKISDNTETREKTRTTTPVKEKPSEESGKREQGDGKVGKQESRSHRSSQDKRRRSHSRSRRRSHRSRSRDRRRKSSRDRGSRRSRGDRKRSKSRERRDSHSARHADDKRGERRRSRDRHSRRRHSPGRRRRREKKRSRSRDRRRHRSRERHGRRSRSKTPEKKKTFKETMRERILQAQKDVGPGIDMEAIKKHLAAGGKIANPQALLMNAALISPLTTGEKVTPQEAVRQQMAAMQQKAQELTGIAVPKYYNPAAVNPLKYAEQVQKRKLLWSKPKEQKEDVNQQLWQATSFGQDKVDEKFRKLMGVKGEGGAEVDASIARLNEEQRRKQQELFSQLDKEYAMARITTHTHRGIGLGAISFNVAPPAGASSEAAPPAGAAPKQPGSQP